MASTRAIDPPPAPISTVSTTGVRIGIPDPGLNRCTRAASIIGAIRGRPLSMRLIFAVVPPMSKATASGRPISDAIPPAKIAPAAGPDSSKRTGKRRATSGVARVPEESNRRNFPPAPCSASSIRAKYRLTRGWVYALHTVVQVRSYSRISGQTSLLADTQRYGNREVSSSRTLASWMGFRYACRNTTATASTPSATSAATALWVPSRSTGRRTAPSRVIRSSTSKRHRRGTKGSGNRRNRS